MVGGGCQMCRMVADGRLAILIGGGILPLACVLVETPSIALSLFFPFA